MQPISRIEMIVSASEVDKTIEVLETVGVPCYTLIRNAIGKSNLGKVSDDVNLGSSRLSNVFIICYCSPDQVDPIVQRIKPILDKYGGVCYLSDAMAINSVYGKASPQKGN